MRWLNSATSRAVLAVCMLGAVACGDDDGGDDGVAAPVDGGTVEGNQRPDGGGANSGMDGGNGGALLDSGLVIDATTPPGTDTPDGGRSTIPDGGGGTVADASNGPDAATACANGCNDGVQCTVDRCVENRCVHAIDDSVCGAGASCSLTAGCMQGAACANAADCADTNGCTFNERCDPMLARCVWDVLDRDGDGDAPVSCGGTDCNDANGLVGPGAVDRCDGVDNDCDGTVDEAASCGAGSVCAAGECGCAEGFLECGFECVDVKSDADHCGECGNDCGSGGECTNGACSCPATSTVCGESCSDLELSTTNCGACGAACPGVGEDGQLQACLAGACTACGGLDQPCCRNAGCLPAGAGASCTGTAGAADSKCVCPAGSLTCEGECVDPRSDEANCGACGTACEAFEVCRPAGETAACVACGGVGQPCCHPDVPGFDLGLCRGGAACGPNDSCVRPNVPAAAGPAPVPPMSMPVTMDAGTPDAGPQSVPAQ